MTCITTGSYYGVLFLRERQRHKKAKSGLCFELGFDGSEPNMSYTPGQASEMLDIFDKVEFKKWYRLTTEILVCRFSFHDSMILVNAENI